MNIRMKNEKEWTLKEYDREKAVSLAKELGISEFIAKLLVIRGFDKPDTAADFLSPYDYSFCDPFLLQDMDKAVARIKTALEKGERILIYGDYDVDGISAVSAIYLYLRSKGANVCYYIPERLTEGYGLNNCAIDKFAAAKIDLIITVDTGITAFSETEYIKQKGLDIIITDHHECPEVLPQNACAVINPKRRDSAYPFSELAGVGVVFKLICAIDGVENIKSLCEKYLDIVSLGTVADVMPLYGENRRIVTHGLTALNKGEHVGIGALLDCALPDSSGGQRRITASTIGFAIAPRLNAAGRIGNVKHAAELLISNDAERASVIARELCALNRERQAIENEILSQAIEKLESEFDFEKDRVIVLGDDNWHQGVIGIVASRITEKYGLPSILVTFSGENGKGSARSIQGFNINDALGACEDTLLKFGGHEIAAGLSLEKSKFEEFRTAINDYARDIITDEMRVMHISADCEIEACEIDLDHASQLSLLEPYGNMNPAPVFILREAVVSNITPIGMNKHLKITLTKDGKNYIALYFNRTPDDLGILEGYTVDVAFNLEVNEFRGNRSVQMNIRDMKISGCTAAYINRQAKDYLRAIATFTVSKENLPDMQAFRSAFVYLRTVSKQSGQLDIGKAASDISHEFSINVTPCMLNIMFDVFAEMGLVKFERNTLNDIDFTLPDVEGKVNLESSKLLTKLKNSSY